MPLAVQKPTPSRLATLLGSGQCGEATPSTMGQNARVRCFCAHQIYAAPNVNSSLEPSRLGDSRHQCDPSPKIIPGQGECGWIRHSVLCATGISRCAHVLVAAHPSTWDCFLRLSRRSVTVAWRVHPLQEQAALVRVVPSSMR